MYASIIAMSLLHGLDSAKRIDVDDLTAECQTLLLKAMHHFDVNLGHMKSHSDAKRTDNAVQTNL